MRGIPVTSREGVTSPERTAEKCTVVKMSYAYLFKYIIIGDTGGFFYLSTYKSLSWQTIVEITSTECL